MSASTSKELPLIQGLWIGDELPDVAQVSIRSFIEQGHPYHLYSYKPFPNLPPGCIRKDANEVLPEKCIYARAHGGSIASFSDWFRYELLNKKGGYYVDLDVVCLKPFDIDEYFVSAYESDHARAGEPADRLVTNGAVLRTKPGNMLWRLMCLFFRYPRFFLIARGVSRFVRAVIFRPQKGWRRELYRYRRDWGLLFGGIAGIREHLGVELSHYTYRSLVYIFAMRLKRYAVMPRHYFYPLSFKDRGSLLNDAYANTDNPFPDSYAVHLWYSALPKRKVREPHPNSLWVQLCKKYLPGR